INPNKRNELYQQVRQAEAKGDQTAINQAWKQLNQYDSQVNDSVYATFNGIVSDIKKTNVGNGEPILKLIADEPQIKTTVSEFDLNKISVGDDVNVTVTSTGKKGKGKIKSISELPTSYDQAQQAGGQGAMSGADPSGVSGEGQAMTASNPTETNPTGGDDSASSKYTVMIGDLDFDVRNGFSVEAEIPLDTIKLPSSVLTKDDHVYVVDKDGTVDKRQIKYDDNNGDLILKKGLKKGDKLIKNPDSDLKDGKKVEVSS
ncbi:efflux RND transporter periplasmic adaptor subunit, partial [Staphylococcus chromogenes]|uniref:efflux RND transporter periplasmic adaptor subunit n=1 Tax=Staphylococcus chromogenes TaxID=46126 RepID=UPI002903FB12